MEFPRFPFRLPRGVPPIHDVVIDSFRSMTSYNANAGEDGFVPASYNIYIDMTDHSACIAFNLFQIICIYGNSLT